MTMRRLQWIALFGLVIALTLPPMAAAQSAADTYKAKCAMCHGADGMGKAAMGTKDMGSADIQKMSDADLTAAITSGKGKMPAYKGKTDRRADQGHGFLYSHLEKVIPPSWMNQFLAAPQGVADFLLSTGGN